jgi:hypothetical protein
MGGSEESAAPKRTAKLLCSISTCAIPSSMQGFQSMETNSSVDDEPSFDLSNRSWADEWRLPQLVAVYCSDCKQHSREDDKQPRPPNSLPRAAFHRLRLTALHIRHQCLIKKVFFFHLVKPVGQGLKPSRLDLSPNTPNCYKSLTDLHFSPSCALVSCSTSTSWYQSLQPSDCGSSLSFLRTRTSSGTRSVLQSGLFHKRRRDKG